MAACGAGVGPAGTVSHDGRAYRDEAGWSIDVPTGWHAVGFAESKRGITSAGVQVSNVILPPPSLRPGYLIQVSGLRLPASGVGLIIATDADPGAAIDTLAAPPLPALNGRDWVEGSALPGGPHQETLWFRVDNKIFVVSAKIGSKATRSDLRAVTAVVRSLH